MSTGRSSTTAARALSRIPSPFGSRIEKQYKNLKRRLRSAEYETAGLSAGKLCEIVYRLLEQELTGSHTPFGTPLSDVAAGCRKFEQTVKTIGNESLRIVIPRAVNFLYTLRNKRDIGHVAGDLDANKIDAETIGRVADWIMCELIRIYHKLPIEEAQPLIDALAERQVPDIWVIGKKRRVLRPGLKFPEQTLLLLYHDPHSAVLVEDLLEWVEHSNSTVYKSQVLGRLHKQRLVEYDKENDAVQLSPAGVEEVEKRLSEVKDKSGK